MPNGSMAKFFEERGGESTGHGGSLHWPGTAEGFPHRGPVVPDLRQDEYEEQVKLALDYHSKQFKLWVPDEKTEFEEIMDRIVNGWYMLHKRIDRWADAQCGLLVWLEWVQIYGETPSGKHPGGGYGQATTATAAVTEGTFGAVRPSYEGEDGFARARGFAGENGFR